MSDLGHHGEWLSLLDVSGPFLAEPVLKEALPQGLQGLDPIVKKEVRQAYDEWREALDFDEVEFSKLHGAWIAFVLDRVLGFGAEFLAIGDKLGDGHRYLVPENGITLVPDAAVTDGKGKSLLLVKQYDAQTSLSEDASPDGWAASPIERMIELCRATGIRLALVTNGEQWTLIDAPVGAVTSTASWYARLWSQEPLTLQAFAELLGIRRFFSGAEAELTSLLDKSLTLQDEVTDALGEQVRRAVEVLVQSLDRADQDRNRELLKDVSPEELYEAGLTIMMRIVFLLSAEERGLLLLGDRQYEGNYAVSTLRGQLRLEADEIQERRWDAWSRLLSLFRAVFAGVDHGSMRMPALGGSLFDPDRFPFLEGRSKGSNWKTDAAVPLPIDNRTVLLLLDAVQLFQGRTLSYLALDVEQIGYVYEGLLERTVVRAKEVTLDLTATKNAKAPWATLSELDDSAASGGGAVDELLKERTGSSASRIRNDLAKKPDETESGKLLAACDGDVGLRDRIKPYFHLLRTDSWGYPLVYPKGTFMVASGSDRRETGTHYTPKSFTEAIVRTTLEPLVYVGPSDGAPRDEWRLKSPDELLDLKVCDPAMGSGAFLVQACRYLADRVVEAWAEVETIGKAISADGEVKDEIGALEPLSQNADERSLTARRLIAERCLYGVDMNPLAVELAKLSIWLVTLAKGRPFGFLDHNFRSGDSLLGILSIEQIDYLEMKPGRGSSAKLFASKMKHEVQKAIELRRNLQSRPIREIRDVEVMAALDTDARKRLDVFEKIADALVAEAFSKLAQANSTDLSLEAGRAVEGDEVAIGLLERRASLGLSRDLPSGHHVRAPLHWALQFPEVFLRSRGGFDAVIGNPPFLGGKKISTAKGPAYRSFISWALSGEKGAADLCAFFFLRARSLLRNEGAFGLLATNTICQGSAREIGLARIERNASIFRASSSCPWPGSAGVDVSIVFVFAGQWSGTRILDGEPVDNINSYLTAAGAGEKPNKLQSSIYGTKGTYVYGEGFIVDQPTYDEFVNDDPRNAAVLQRYLGARDFTTTVDQLPTRWAINFGERSEEKAQEFTAPFRHVFETVKPERDKLTRQVHETAFWKHWDRRDELYERIKSRERVLVCPEVSKHCCFAFSPASLLFSHKVNVIPDDRDSIFAILQSNVHAEWAWYNGTTMRNAGLSYTTTGCLATFAIPERLESLESIGSEYATLRKRIMEACQLGLTGIYDRLNDKEDSARDVAIFRDLQVALDAKVLAQYGWADIVADHGFYRAKQGVRFTFSATSRREILNRLLSLNHERFASQGTVEQSKSRKKRATETEGTRSIFEFDQGILADRASDRDGQ